MNATTVVEKAGACRCRGLIKNNSYGTIFSNSQIVRFKISALLSWDIPYPDFMIETSRMPRYASN
jgi:hypothetical protein